MTLRRILLLVCYLALLAGGFWFSEVLHDRVVEAESGPIAVGMIAMGFVFYVLFSAIPFVPGAEIGFGLLMVMGASGAMLVYSGMVMALCIAFLVGRFVPVSWVAWGLGAVGLVRARELVLKSGDLSLDERTRFIRDHAPARIVPFLLRHRYIAMAVLLNFPGNFVLGGGGGLAFAAGASRLFSPWVFLATTLIAVAPIPVAFFFFGVGA